METIKQITYSQICQFLNRKIELAELKELEMQIPFYGIYNFIKNYSDSQTYQSEKMNLTFEQAEEYLEKYLSGNITKPDAVALIEAILSSERNFDKLHYLINEYAVIFSNLKNSSEYENALSDKEIIKQLFRVKNKMFTNNSTLHFTRTKITTAILSAAAVFLALFLIPLQFNKDLNELYSFDDNVPLDFNQSTLRGGSVNGEITDPDYRKFKFQFKKGMTEYLAQEYAKALNDWEGLERKLNLLRNSPNFNPEDKNNFILYSAICRVALYLSEKENFDEEQKKSILTESIYLFEKLSLSNDIEKYHYSLALGLTGKKEKAKEILSSIDVKSGYYNKRIILEEQLNQ